MASDSGAQTQPSGQSKDVFHRLVRSLSGRKGRSQASPSLNPQAAPSTNASVEEQAIQMPTAPSTTPSDTLASSSTPGEPLQRVASSSSSVAKAKVKIADRLKKLGKGIGKLRKGGSSSSSKSASVSASPTAANVKVLHPAIGSSPAQSSGHAKILSMVTELDELDVNPTPAPSNPNPDPDPDDPQAPSATTLAKRIQALVDALPFPAPGQDRVIKKPKTPARDKEGRPIPPATPAGVDDPNLVTFLSDPTVMNGSDEEGRPSMWRLLESLGVPPHGFPPTDAEDDKVEGGAGGGDSGSPSAGGQDGGGHTVITDTTSVMVYFPLIPSAEDLVELADRVRVQVSEEVEEVLNPGTSWTSVWPLSVLLPSRGASQLQTASTNTSPEPKRRLSLDMIIPPRRARIDNPKRPVTVQTDPVKAWVPSTAKLSIQALWWGYRLYLPPPVMLILGDESLEAIKRAALITTALTWFLNNIPIGSLPLPVQPAVLLLQRLAPYLGYIGPFISWSWGTIKGYDVGNGVILTATWLLPVALIPGTWRADDFPKPPTSTQPDPGTVPSPPPQTPQPQPQPQPQPAPSVPPTEPLPTGPSVPPTGSAPDPSLPVPVPGPGPGPEPVPSVSTTNTGTPKPPTA